MKKSTVIILSVAAVAIVLGLTIALISNNTKKQNTDSESTPESTNQVVINVPDVTEPPESDNLPVEDIGEDDVIVTPLDEEDAEAEAEESAEPNVIDSKTETEEKTAEEETAETTDKTVSSTKDESTDKGIDEDGDVINDKILESQEKAAKAKEVADDKANPTVAEDEKTVDDETEKPDVIVEEETPDDGSTDDGKTAVAEYVPQSGEHPFEDPIEGDGGEVYSVDDLVGEDGLRPGEGIHF